MNTGPSLTRLVRGLELLVLAAFLVCEASVSAAASYNPPGQMTFQGFLTDNSGNPLGLSGPINQTVYFRIYKGATTTAASDLMWSEQQVVTVDKGHFSVVLGEGTGITGEAAHTADLSGVFAGTTASDRYLSLQLDGQNAILPRIQFFPAPYAHLARGANALFAPSGSVLTAASGALVASQSITAPTFNGSFVGSGAGLNGLTAGQIPSLDASKVTTGQFDTARIPGLPASRIASGTLDDARLSAKIPRLGANQTFTAANTFEGSTEFTGQASFSANATFSGSRLRNTGEYYGKGLMTLFASAGEANSGDATIQASSDSVDASIGFRFKTENAGVVVDALRIQPGGNVGIGTTAPKARLHNIGEYYGKGHVYLHAYEGDGENGTAYVMARDDTTTSTIALQLRTKDGNTIRDVMRLTRLGRVGIGTLAPEVPLHVVGTVSRPREGEAGNIDVSIRAEGHIQADGLDQFSDRRLKEVVQRSTPREDLETIRQLSVTDYRFVDRTRSGSALRKGFIAQEVRAVIPEAVSASPGFLPDILAASTGTEFRAGTGTLQVRLDRAHGLKTGDTVRLELDGQSRDLVVAGVPDEKVFEVDSVTGAPRQVFVYGRRVPDLLTVQYDRIFTTGIGAIQELARRVEALEKDGTRIAELEKKAARVDTLERELAELRKQVALIAGVRRGDGEPGTDLAAAVRAGEPR